MSMNLIIDLTQACQRVLGDGLNMNFWGDRKGRENALLKERFPRLYHLSRSKVEVVGNMGAWGEEGWTWNLRWTQRLRGRDEEVERDLMAWLQGINIKRDSPDFWKWGESEKGIFSVKKAYKIIEDSFRVENRNTPREEIKMMWKFDAPFKQIVMG